MVGRLECHQVLVFDFLSAVETGRTLLLLETFLAGLLAIHVVEWADQWFVYSSATGGLSERKIVEATLTACSAHFGHLDFPLLYYFVA